jgi:hypothetical protein
MQMLIKSINDGKKECEDSLLELLHYRKWPDGYTAFMFSVWVAHFLESRNEVFVFLLFYAVEELNIKKEDKD